MSGRSSKFERSTGRAGSSRGRLLGHIARSVLLGFSLLFLASLLVLRDRPSWIDGLDRWIQDSYTRGPRIRLEEAQGLAGADPERAADALLALHRDLEWVRRGDRLEQTAALAAFFASRALLAAGRKREAVAAADWLSVFDPRNVDGILHRARIRAAAGIERSTALRDLEELHARIPESIRVTEELVRLSLEAGDAEGAAKALGAFEEAVRPNSWEILYKAEGAAGFDLVHRGLLVPESPAEGRLSFAFRIEEPQAALRIRLPAEPLLRLLDPVLEHEGRIVPLARLSGGLKPVPGGVQAEGATGEYLEYELPRSASGAGSRFCFEVGVERLLAPGLVAAVAGSTLEPGLDEDRARFCRYRVAAALARGLPVRRGKTEDLAEVLASIEPGGLAFRFRLPADETCTLALPAVDGASFAIEGAEPEADVVAEGGRLVVRGPSPAVRLIAGRGTERRGDVR